eukprot:SM000115S23897  [mRNA]  locus=s115:66902:71686:- [translate_table: standard]
MGAAWPATAQRQIVGYNWNAFRCSPVLHGSCVRRTRPVAGGVLRAAAGVQRSAAAQVAAVEELPHQTDAARDDAAALADTEGLGATLDGRGGCVFRLWAPNADAAEVRLWDKAGDSELSGRTLALDRAEDGVWQCRLPSVYAGARYHFVIQHGGHSHVRRDARARQTEFDTDACIVRNRGQDYVWAPFKAPPWSRLILYQLHIGAFTGREDGGGTFAALERKLDYIASLGFTAIQPLPVHEYCGQWGYNPRLLLAIHQAYGSPDDIRRLVDQAHKRGLAVIFDMVLNHGAAKLNSLWAYDGANPDNKGGIYFDGGRDTPWGKSFAFWQREVQAMLLDAAIMFLEEYNGDGLRFDSVHSMPWDLLQKLTWQLKARYPEKILISGVKATHLVSKDHARKPEVIHGAGFNSTWMHYSYYQTRAFMGGHRDLQIVESLMGVPPGYTNSTQASIHLACWSTAIDSAYIKCCVKYFLGCHDQVGCRKSGGYDEEIKGYHRYAVETWGGRGNWDARAASRMWYVANVTAYCIPMLFSGTEYHQSNWWGIDKDHCLDWGLADDNHGRQMRALVTAANALRVGSAALQHGSVSTVHFDGTNGILGIRRQAGADEGLLVVINASGNQWERYDYGLRIGPSDSDWQTRSFVEIFNSQAEAFGGWATSGNGHHRATPADRKIQITIPMWSVLVFKPVT